MSADEKLAPTVWRCEFTGNPAGTDARMIGAAPCRCTGCRAASALEASEAKIAALTAENDTLREKVERSAEDERDRLYVMVRRSRGTYYVNDAWFRKEGAMLPSARAALRQEGKP